MTPWTTSTASTSSTTTSTRGTTATLDDPKVSVEGQNPLCGDHLHLDCATTSASAAIRFRGKGCAISQAATSMLTERVEGKPVDGGRRAGARGHRGGGRHPALAHAPEVRAARPRRRQGRAEPRRRHAAARVEGGQAWTRSTGADVPARRHGRDSQPQATEAGLRALADGGGTRPMRAWLRRRCCAWSSRCRPASAATRSRSPMTAVS